MGAAFRNEQHLAVFGAQCRSIPRPVGRRIGPKIQYNIKHGPTGTTHQFRLVSGRSLVVHSPYRTAGVTEAYVCLEGREYDPVLLELFRTPSTHEAPPEIAVRRRLNKPRIVDRAPGKNHCDRPPLSGPGLMLVLRL